MRSDGLLLHANLRHRRSCILVAFYALHQWPRGLHDPPQHLNAGTSYNWANPVIGTSSPALHCLSLLKVQLHACSKHMRGRWKRVHVLQLGSKRSRVDVARQGVVRAPQQQILRVHGIQLCGATCAEQSN
jgi:hypothetical protein